MEKHQTSPARRRLRVTVLRGGPSPERDVSLVSGAAVASALRQRGHQVYESDVGPDNLAALEQPADVVFPVLHGTFGEDGALQRIMEERGICFVGSDAQASALAMDKVATKETVVRCGIPAPLHEVWTAERLREAGERREQPSPCPRPGREGDSRGGAPVAAANATVAEAATGKSIVTLGSQLALPVVVKPVDQGSSVATFVVREARQFEEAIRRVVTGFGRALVEQFIEGDEITVGILGREALPTICIRPRRTFYDYEAKYQDDATEYVFDSGHPVRLLEQARAWSLAAFQALGCRHLGRADWMADRDGRLWFLEMNTIPGFTSHSLVPKAAAHVGIEFDELCERLVFMAMADAT